jgi:hypothetical protein
MSSTCVRTARCVSVSAAECNRRIGF